MNQPSDPNCKKQPIKLIYILIFSYDMYTFQYGINEGYKTSNFSFLFFNQLLLDYFIPPDYTTIKLYFFFLVVPNLKRVTE